MAGDRFIDYEAYRTLAFGSISSSYADLGVITLKDADDIHLINNTDKIMIFSVDDGDTDAVVVLPGGAYSGNYYQKNKTLIKGSQLRVKDAGDAATSGSVYAIVEEVE